MGPRRRPTNRPGWHRSDSSSLSTASGSRRRARALATRPAASRGPSAHLDAQAREVAAAPVLLEDALVARRLDHPAALEPAIGVGVVGVLLLAGLLALVDVVVVHEPATARAVLALEVDLGVADLPLPTQGARRAVAPAQEGEQVVASLEDVLAVGVARGDVRREDLLELVPLGERHAPDVGVLHASDRLEIDQPSQQGLAHRLPPRRAW